MLKSRVGNTEPPAIGFQQDAGLIIIKKKHGWQGEAHDLPQRNPDNSGREAGIARRRVNNGRSQPSIFIKRQAGQQRGGSQRTSVMLGNKKKALRQHVCRWCSRWSRRDRFCLNAVGT